MAPDEVYNFLKEENELSSMINWDDDVIPPTEIWYDKEKNAMVADCGISIPFNYDPHGEMYHCILDIRDAIIDFYKEKGIIIHG